MGGECGREGEECVGRGGECRMKEEGRKDGCVRNMEAGRGDGMGKRRFMCLRDI